MPTLYYTPTEAQIKRFWDNVSKPDNPNECWLWTGETNPKGYGRFRFGNKNSFAHRFSYLLAHGYLETDLFVCHSCDTPSCVNPAHLFQGTAKMNNADRDAKGRHVALKGEKHGNCKLTDEQVKEIRALYSMGGYSYRELGRMYSVSRDNICRIVKRKSRV